MPHITGHSGVHWHFEIEGEGDHLLFLHGWGVDKRIWRQQVKFFSQYFKTMIIDLPGHGKSSFVKTSLSDMAVDLKHILDHLGCKRVKMVGSSLGGLLALKFYSLYPDVVERISFVGSMPKFASSFDYPYGLNIAEMRKLAGQLNQAYPSIINIFFRSLFTDEERQSRRFKWLLKFKPTEDVPMKEALAEYLDVLEKEDLREDLKRVTASLQFITGSGDQIVSTETLEYIKKIKPEAQYFTFDQCGHFPFLSKPHEFNQVLADFLFPKGK